MRLEEDDFNDYEQDSFDEDAAVSDVIRALKPVRISEQEAEVALDKVEWDVDAAIANLKKQNQPKKTVAKPAPKPAPKPAASAAAPEGKLSALQRLAQQRSASRQSSSTSSSTSSLAQLAAQRKAQAAQSPSRASSVLDRLRERRGQASASEKNRSPSAPEQAPGVADVIQAPEEKQAPKPWSPPISYDHTLAAELGAPSGFGEVIQSAADSHSLSSEDTNSFVGKGETKKAFSQPSPDDVVLAAQAEAFAKLKGAATAQPPKAPTPAAKPAPKQKTPQPKSATQKSELVAKMAQLKMKPSSSFVVIGHVDAGKSTLMGRLLLDTGALSQKVVNQFEHESAKAGKSSFWLAWALDATKEERERGVTVDVGEASFETSSTRFTVLDAPGHRDYVPNMIAGVAQAEVAVLVVDSDTNAFESGFSLDGQTKEHAILARSLGVDRIVVAVNKMDTQDWSETRFEEISIQLTEFLTKKVGFDNAKIVFIPTSGISGVNVVKRGGPEWYTGPSLVSALETFAQMNPSSVDPTEDPVRFLVSNAFVERFQSTLTASGRMLSGAIERGDVLDIVNQGRQVTVKAIANDAEFLGPREVSDLKLQLDSSGSAEEDSVAIRPGDVLASASAGLVTTTKFTAKVRLFDIPRPVLPGTKLSFHMGSVDDSVKVVKIIGSLAAGSNSTRKIRHLGKGAAAIVELELETPTVLTPPSVCKDLGRFVLRLNGATIGGGVVDTLL